VDFLETNHDVIVPSGLDGTWTSRFLKLAKQLQPELDEVEATLLRRVITKW